MKDSRSTDEISAALARLAAKYACSSPPADLESRLMTELKARSTASRRAFPFWTLGITTPTVLALVVLYGGGTHTKAKEEPFYQMPYVAPVAPYERTEVRREMVPVAALVAAGLDVHVPDSGAVITADVLFGQDGRALAIRLVTGPAAMNTRRIER